jgi:protocatechuate 3,4-dioxygenase alpha subunit
MMPSATSSQTIGPYWHLIDDPTWADLTRFGASGERITLCGRVTDGEGAPISDACIEIWQSDPPTNETFPGFGRSATDQNGEFRFTTVKPDAVPGNGNAIQAPHILVTILARGLVKALFTRAYFAGEPLNENDPLLSAIDNPQRRATLIATADGAATWRLNICLQGDNESLFLDI